MAISYLPAAEGAQLPEWTKLAPSSYLQDVMQTNAPDADAICAGFYKQEDGEVLEFTYPFDEFKYVFEVVGEFFITDEVKTYNVKAGDVILINKGTSMKFETKGGYAKVFYVAKKPLGPPK